MELGAALHAANKTAPTMEMETATQNSLGESRSGFPSFGLSRILAAVAMASTPAMLDFLQVMASRPVGAVVAAGVHGALGADEILKIEGVIMSTACVVL